MTDTLPPTCILTGADGENPDDCTTHDHESDSAQSQVWEVLAVVPSHLRLPDDPALWTEGYAPQPVVGEAAAKALAAHAVMHPEVTYVEILHDGEVVEVVNNPAYVETRPTAEDGTVL